MNAIDSVTAFISSFPHKFGSIETEIHLTCRANSSFNLIYEITIIDVEDQEDLFDEKEIPIMIEEMMMDLQEIMNKYMKKLNRKFSVLI